VTEKEQVLKIAADQAEEGNDLDKRKVLRREWKNTMRNVNNLATSVCKWT